MVRLKVQLYRVPHKSGIIAEIHNFLFRQIRQDLTPLDFYLWDHLKMLVYAEKIGIVEHLAAAHY